MARRRKKSGEEGKTEPQTKPLTKEETKEEETEKSKFEEHVELLEEFVSDLRGMVEEEGEGVLSLKTSSKIIQANSVFNSLLSLVPEDMKTPKKATEKSDKASRLQRELDASLTLLRDRVEVERVPIGSAQGFTEGFRQGPVQKSDEWPSDLKDLLK